MVDLNTYLLKIHSISGWCNPFLWNCIEPIEIFQKDNNIAGPIGEIGVYHGKFFCGLALTKGKDLKHIAIDLFDLQEFNLDNAGVGDFNKFKENLRNWEINNVEIKKADSTAIEREFLESKEKSYSLFSVDGCHLPEHTINDFKIAMKLVKTEGIIFIDDYYNPNWPGVHEGISKFYQLNNCNFIPLLFTCNKLFVCHISYHNLYLNQIFKFLKKNYKSSKVKKVKRYGYDTLTVTPDITKKTFLKYVKN